MHTYPDSVRFLYSLGNEGRTLKLGLERISLLLERLGNPHRRLRCIHVAGTNGKGSVCAFIESGLRAAGFRTGLFTSPHLVEPVERIQIGGRPVSPEHFAEAFEQVHAEAERLLADGLLDGHPSYFETVAAMAFWLFARLSVEYAVVEVGLGGRLDATNVVTPELAVITPVDYDHEFYLGKSLEAIAAEKAGIIKPGIPLVISPQRYEVEALLAGFAARAGAPLVRTSEWRAEDVLIDQRGSRFVAAGALRLPIQCPLAGEHQVSNVLTAVAALNLAGVRPEAIQEGIRRARWPGRLEWVSENPAILLDGAHNPAGARALANYVRRFGAGRRLRLVYAAMRDKAVEEVASILFPLAEEVILTTTGQPRAVRPEYIRELAGRPDAVIAPTVEQAVHLARQNDPQKWTIITGSLYLVGAARALLVK